METIYSLIGLFQSTTGFIALAAFSAVWSGVMVLRHKQDPQGLSSAGNGIILLTIGAGMASRIAFFAITHIQRHYRRKFEGVVNHA